MLSDHARNWLENNWDRGLSEVALKAYGPRPTDRQLVDLLYAQVRYPPQDHWNRDYRLAGDESTWQPYDDATQAIIDLKREMQL